MKVFELKIFFILNELSLKFNYKIFYFDDIKIFSRNKHQGNLKNNFFKIFYTKQKYFKFNIQKMT
jgi:hypothetical protein